MSKSLIGYTVGWNDTPASKLTGSGYIDSRAGATLTSEVFTKISDAKIILAAEKLRTPHMDWRIFEVHRAGKL